MGKLILKRFAILVVTMLLIITITFIMMHAIPGGPFTRESNLPDAVVSALNAKYSLDAPLWKQYIDYISGILRFDFGPSLQRSGLSVTRLLAEGLPVTLKLGVAAIAFILFIGVPLGMLSVIKYRRWQDGLIMFLTTLGIATPSFVVATWFIYIFSGKLGILPSNGMTTWRHMIGPVIALSGFSISFIVKLIRASMLEVMAQDYITMAKSKGLSPNRVFFMHALRNAAIPVVTYIGPMVATLLTGSFVIERIFAIPGIGKHFVESVGNRDYTVLLGITILYALILMTMVMIVDLLYNILDPRTRSKRW